MIAFDDLLNIVATEALEASIPERPWRRPGPLPWPPHTPAETSGLLAGTWPRWCIRYVGPPIIVTQAELGRAARQFERFLFKGVSEERREP